MFRICLYLVILSASVYSNSRVLTRIHIKGDKCQKVLMVDYDYDTWYKIADNATVASNDDVLLKFYVLSFANAYIMLADLPSTSFSSYEIVLSGESNSLHESCIRRSNSTLSETVTTIRRRRELSGFHYTGFWIRVSRQTGLIQVGRAGETFPFMIWTDGDLMPVQYFSFSSAKNKASSWAILCRSEQDAAAAPPDTAAEATADHTEKFLTHYERLRRHILEGNRSIDNDPTKNGQSPLTVTITSSFEFIHLQWTDNGINWNPSDYNSISKLHLSNHELWQPELVVHNALDPATSMFSESKVSVDNDGNVMWRPRFDIKTKCDIDLKSWPWDQHRCTLQFSSWSHKISNVVYEINQVHKPECFQVAHSDWKLDTMYTSYVLDSTPWDNVMTAIDDKDDTSRLNSKAFVLLVEISRNTKILEKLFYAPLLLIACFWLSSFCVLQNPSSKITIICTSIILGTLVIFYMTTYVPVFTEFPPNLLLGYLKLMFLISTDAFISSVLITVHSRKTTSGHPPFALTRFLTTPVVANLLFLPKLNATTTLWDVLIVAIERIVFLTYIVITLVVLSTVKISEKSLL